MEVKCKKCGINFVKSNQEYNRARRNGRDYFFCTQTCATQYGNEIRGYKSYPIEKKCPRCLNSFTVLSHSSNKTYCSRFCSNSRPQTIKTKQKIAKSVSIKSKQLWNNPEYIEKQLNRPKMFTSKGEVEIRTFFIQYLKADGWTFGGCLSFGNVRLTRDLYSEKLKVCIEYDGVWHFKDIKGQLADKQNKDRLLEEWCLKNRYRLIRLKDDLYRSNRSFWLKTLLGEVYFGTEKVVKFY